MYVISAPTPRRESSLHQRTCEEIATLVTEKPALVSGFIIDAKCMASGVSFEGRVNKESKQGLPAMLFIGAQKDPSGKFWFLLQNWWLNRFLIEVDCEYLSSSGCSLHFVQNTINEIPGNLSIVKSSNAETRADACETVHEI